MTPFKPRSGRSMEEVEMDRILALPISRWPDEEDVEIASFERVHADAYTRGDRLFPTQVAGIQTYEELGGGIFPIQVGFGKTGLCLMIAQAAYARGLKKILWLLPVRLLVGLEKRHIPEWRRRVPLALTFHQISGRARGARANICNSGAPGVYIFPYSLLSVQDTMSMLEGINPDLIIADEVHHLKNAGSAMTKRILHFMKHRDPKPQFVGMTGTLTSKKISEYHHLLTMALGERSPLPIHASTCFRWGMILDTTASATREYERRLMSPLVEWARDNFQDQLDESITGFRTAYQRRFVSAPGIVATSSERPRASLTLLNMDLQEPTEALRKIIRTVDTDYETPTGEPINHAIHTYKWLVELAAGFYNNLVWPTPEELVKYRKLSAAEAESTLERAKAHLAAQQEYDRELREFFKDAPIGYDTPMQVGRALAKGEDLGSSLLAAWQAVRAMDFEGRPDRKPVPVRVDDYKVRAAVEWARERGRGIVWVWHREMGRWISEALAKAGLDPLDCPAGEDDAIESVGDLVRGGKGDRIVVASLAAHGVGRNLQAFCDQLIVQWPRACDLAEQMLGRTHRTGQPADEVTATTMLGTEFDHVNRAATLNDAVYVQQTTGAPQRVLYCDYEPMPKIYSPEFLASRGMAPTMLNAAQRRILTDQFDSPARSR